MIVIELCQAGYVRGKRGLQLSISHVDEHDVGDGYRIFGPKFLGDSDLVVRHVIDERDAREIRAYLDREFPVPGALPPLSEESRRAAAGIVADIIAEVES